MAVLLLSLLSLITTNLLFNIVRNDRITGDRQRNVTVDVVRARTWSYVVNTKIYHDHPMQMSDSESATLLIQIVKTFHDENLARRRRYGSELRNT